MSDFGHQWSRYFFYTNKSRQYFGEELIRREMSVPGLWRTIMSCLTRHPLCGLMWLVGFTISRVEFMLKVNFNKYERGYFWTKSSPISKAPDMYDFSKPRVNTSTELICYRDSQDQGTVKH